MERRKFIQGLCTLVAVTSVVPATILSTIPKTSKRVILLDVPAGSKTIKVWVDFEQYQRMKKFYGEQEIKLSNSIWYGS